MRNARLKTLLSKIYSPTGEAIWLSVSGSVAIGFILWVSLTLSHQKLVLIVGLPLYLATLLLSLLYSFRPLIFLREVRKEISGYGEPDFYLVGIPFGLFATFVIVSHSINAVWPGTCFSVTPNATRSFAWVLYGIDNVIRAVLLDFAEIYFVDISGIDHKKGFWVCSFVFSFRTVLSIGLVSLIIRSWREILRTKTQHPAQQQPGTRASTSPLSPSR